MSIAHISYHICQTDDKSRDRLSRGAIAFLEVQVKGERDSPLLPERLHPVSAMVHRRDQALDRRDADGQVTPGMVGQHPIGLGGPADVARAVAFLALPDADYTTGQLLAVDGGYLAQGLSI
jgi:NAD(P)-dependent dehydrogenase (short-subunit alcohol dehydrogenase family)